MNHRMSPMSAEYTFNQLKKDVADGNIDTVLV